MLAKQFHSLLFTLPCDLLDLQLAHAVLFVRRPDGGVCQLIKLYAVALFNRYKVLKNQDFDPDTALMGYRRDDMDASYLTGSFISLYATNPLAKDDLTVVQGMGTQMGGTKAFENAMMKFIIE